MALERVLLKPPQEAEEIVYDMFHHVVYPQLFCNRPDPIGFAGSFFFFFFESKKFANKTLAFTCFSFS